MIIKFLFFLIVVKDANRFPSVEIRDRDECTTLAHYNSTNGDAISVGRTRKDDIIFARSNSKKEYVFQKDQFEANGWLRVELSSRLDTSQETLYFYVGKTIFDAVLFFTLFRGILIL